jgi:hypothetical protein
MMLFDRRVFLTGLVGLGACSGTPPEVARLPEFRGFVSIDAVRYSIEQGADILTNQRRLTGQPWEVARLVQALEFLAVELRNGPRSNVMLPMAQIAVPAARPEWRQAFGIAADARAQEVIAPRLCGAQPQRRSRRLASTTFHAGRARNAQSFR